MQEVSDSTTCYEESDIRFYDDGTIFFLNQNRAFVDGTGIAYQEENGLRVRQERGASKPLHLTDAEGVEHVFCRKGATWYRLVPRESKIGTVDAAARLFRQKGLVGLVCYAGCFFVVYCLISMTLGVVSSELLPAPKPVTSFHKPAPPPVLVTPADSPLSAVTFPSDHELAWAAGMYLTVYDTQSNTEIHRVAAPGAFHPTISTLAASPTGDSIAAVIDNEVCVWQQRRKWISRPTPQKKATASYDPTREPPPLPVFDEPLPAPPIDLQALAWSPSGSTLAAAGGGGSTGKIELLDARDLHPVATLHTATPVLALAWSPDSQQLAAATMAQEVVVWKVSSRRQVMTLASSNPAYSQYDWQNFPLAYSPAGGVLATCWPDESQIRFLDVHTNADAGAVDVGCPVASLAYTRGEDILVGLLPGDGNGGDLVLIDTACKEVVATMKLSVKAWKLTVSPAGTIAVCGNRHIQLISVSELRKEFKVKQTVRQDSNSVFEFLRGCLVAGDQGEAN